jgi:hypothetical protein
MKELSETLSTWAEAKRLSFAIDSHFPAKSGGLRKHGVEFPSVPSSDLSKEVQRIRELFNDLGIVEPESLSSIDIDERQLAEASKYKFLTQEIRRLYLEAVCSKDGWPRMLPYSSEKQIKEGIPLFSVSGNIEGRATGSRRKCIAGKSDSDKCPGWFIGVLWESGQQMYICSEGWHYDLENDRIDVIGGGEISARFVSPKPLGVSPLPRDVWPDRESLVRRKGWRVSP